MNECSPAIKNCTNLNRANGSRIRGQRGEAVLKVLPTLKGQLNIVPHFWGSFQLAGGAVGYFELAASLGTKPIVKLLVSSASLIGNSWLNIQVPVTKKPTQSPINIQQHLRGVHPGPKTRDHKRDGDCKHRCEGYAVS
jgi:hypothetical protein